MFDDYCTRVVAGVRQDLDGPDDEAFARLAAHVQFLRPARRGRLTGRGRVVRRGRDVAFLAGELADDSGQIVAVATATAQIRAVRP